MKRKVLVSLAGLCLVCMSSTSNAEVVAADATALWHHITQESPYTDWEFWDDHMGVQAGDAPHGPLHRIFINDTAREMQTAPVSFGTIVVKENMDKSEKLLALTVMYKVEGYNPEAGDWFWAKYSPTGEVDKAGKLKGCISCHASVAENDFMYVHQLERE